MVLALGGLGFKIAAFPFHMWVPDAYEAASTPFVAWLSVAPKAAGFVVIFRLYLEGVGSSVLLWVPLAAGLATLTIIAGNLMAPAGTCWAWAWGYCTCGMYSWRIGD